MIRLFCVIVVLSLMSSGVRAGTATTNLSVNIIAGGGNGGYTYEPPECNVGNHSAIRTRPIIAHGTVVAGDSKCLLVGGGTLNLYSGGSWSSTDGYNDLPSWQATHDIKHMTVYRSFVGLTYSGNSATAPNYFHDMNYWTAYYDTSVNNANQSGMYIMIGCDTRNGPNYDYAAGIDWTGCNTFFQTLAARYANNTNVFFEIANEPDSNGDYSGEDTVYHTIRNAAPNSLVVSFTFCCNGSLSVVQSISDINYSNAAVGYHLYGNAGLAGTLQSNGYPVLMTEYGPCGTNFPQCDTNMLNTLQATISAFNLSDPSGFAINWPKD